MRTVALDAGHGVPFPPLSLCAARPSIAMSYSLFRDLRWYRRSTQQRHLRATSESTRLDSNSSSTPSDVTYFDDQHTHATLHTFNNRYARGEAKPLWRMRVESLPVSRGRALGLRQPREKVFKRVLDGVLAFF